jgi:hypothetical protein
VSLDSLYEIISECTIQLRKGEEIKRSEIKNRDGDTVMHTVDIYDMPHVSHLKPDANVEKIDVHFMVVGVIRDKADEKREALIRALESYPEPDRLKGGPSHIEVGANIGDQGAALSLFALGEYLGFWKVITPEKLGITGAEADQLAGAGFVMIDGYKPHVVVGG